MKYGNSIEANRRFWNKRADVHAQGYVVQLRERVQKPDFSTFDDVERRIFASIGLKGKSVIQLGCNNGRELISVKKAGAGRCVGVDISDTFIAQGRQLASLAQIDVELIRSSVYDIAHDLCGQFDLVYITIGVLGWLPDLGAFFAIVANLLKPGGQLFLYDEHPILNMYEADKGLVPTDSYFRTEPFVDAEAPDYFDPTQIIKAVSYWFPYKLSDVIGACLEHGLSLTHFEEYGHDVGVAFVPWEKLPNKPPLSYSLLARKAN